MNDLDVVLALMIGLFLLSMVFFFFLQRLLNKQLRKSHSIHYLINKNSELYYYAYWILIGVLVGVFIKAEISKNILKFKSQNQAFYIYMICLLLFIYSFVALWDLNRAFIISLKKYTSRFKRVVFVNCIQMIAFSFFVFSERIIGVTLAILISIYLLKTQNRLQQLHKKIKYMVLVNIVLANIVTASMMIYFTVNVFDDFKVSPIIVMDDLALDFNFENEVVDLRNNQNQNSMVIFYLAIIEIFFLVFNYIAILIMTYLDYLFGIFVEKFTILYSGDEKIIDIGIVKSVDGDFINFISVKKHKIENWFLLENVVYNKNIVFKMNASDNLIFRRYEENKNTTVEFD